MIKFAPVKVTLSNPFAVTSVAVSTVKLPATFTSSAVALLLIVVPSTYVLKLILPAVSLKVTLPSVSIFPPAVSRVSVSALKTISAPVAVNDCLLVPTFVLISAIRL